jgi:hypothetical protein
MSEMTQQDGLLADLRQLDPFAFWIIPGAPFEVDYAVLGITGGFVVVADEHDGYVKIAMKRATAGGERIQGFSKARRGARLFQEQLSRINVHVPEVEAFMCFRRATVGRPQQFKGVWLANPADLRRIITDRSPALQHKDAKDYASRLGAVKDKDVGAKPLVDEPEAEGDLSDANDAALGGLASLGGFGDFV